MKKEDPELTIISITHDIEEAYIGDRVIILNNGNIIKNDTPSVVFSSKDEIESLGFELPFVLKVKESLKDKVKIDDSINNIEDLAKILCQ